MNRTRIFIWMTVLVVLLLGCSMSGDELTDATEVPVEVTESSTDPPVVQTEELSELDSATEPEGDVTSTEEVQDSPTATPDIEYEYWEVAWSGVGNSAEHMNYIDVTGEIVGSLSGGQSWEAALEELDLVAEAAEEHCGPHRLDYSEGKFLIYGFYDIGEECLDVFRDLVPVYEGFPPEAWERLQDFSDSPYEDGPFWFLSSEGFYQYWEYRHFPLAISSTGELGDMECFLSAMEFKGWSGEDFVVFSAEPDSSVWEVLHEYGIVSPHIEYPEIPKFCMSGTVREGLKPEKVNFDAFSGKEVLSYGTPEGKSITLELTYSTWGIRKVSLVHEGTALKQGYSFSPWTLIYLEGAEVYLTFNESGEALWLVTDDWSVASRVASIVVKPDPGEDLPLGASPMLPQDVYRLDEGGVYSIKRQKVEWDEGM